MLNKKIKLIPYVSTGPYRMGTVFFIGLHFYNLAWDSTLIYDRIKFNLKIAIIKDGLVYYEKE